MTACVYCAALYEQPINIGMGTCAVCVDARKADTTTLWRCETCRQFIRGSHLKDWECLGCKQKCDEIARRLLNW